MNKNYLILLIFVLAIILSKCLDQKENMTMVKSKVFLKGDPVNEIYNFKKINSKKISDLQNLKKDNNKRVINNISCVQYNVILNQLVKSNKLSNSRKKEILASLRCK